MANPFRALQYHTIATDAKVNRRAHHRQTNVALDEPATVVMTDLNEVTPFAVEPAIPIQAANDKMIACGVRLLFVTDNLGSLLGLITASDLLGERPVKYMTEHGGSRGDIMVMDIMTPKTQLDVIYMRDVATASVGDIVETMKLFNRQHMLVVQHTDTGLEVVCGIFSTTQINRQLGTNIEPSPRVATFADIERVVATA